MKKSLQEMSASIAIRDYDTHEEKHAYFVEMMETMIHTILKATSDKPYTILELGAGTGIFTKRLVRLPHAKVTAVDIDMECCEQLRRNLKDKQNFEILNADSLTLNLNKHYDFVVSSFADHHIRHAQKERYFSVIKKHLRAGGLFIVGDEFLRDHDLNNRDARAQALKDYHHHIIDIARAENEMILVELETSALLSGLLEMGDFKISCESYETMIRKSGFIPRKIKIGPKHISDVGGIYVVTSFHEGD